MLAAGGSRISHQLRECHQHHYRRRHNHRRGVVGLAFGFCDSSSSTRILQLSTSFLLKPQLGDNYNRNRCGYHHGLQHRRTVMSTSSLQSKSSGEIPSLSDCFSQPEDVCDLPSDGLSSVAGGIVALGKFDALHIGHRELAIQASRVGVPYLLSFVGMAEVLGWEPRAPIVAKCDRRRILSSWAPYCGNIVPAEFQVEFSSVRHLTPRQFVEKLSTELGVSGVVAGRNYRFGYKAAGDTSELVRLCKEYGVGAYIINSVMDKNQDPRNIAVSDSKERGQVSSTRVRHALAVGDMKYVSELLGRPHRLKLVMKDQKEFTGSNNRWRISAPKSCLLNLAPKESFYENCTVFLGNQGPVAGRVLIDTTDIHIELDETSLGSCIHSTDSQRLSIEFGD